jgi:hypothetical protein
MTIEPSALAEQLADLGVRGVLAQMARNGQLTEIRCEMPSCYCPKGRRYFERRRSPMPNWAPNPDHYPTLRSAGGTLTPGNVRLAHALCNHRDDGWRTRIRPMLDRGMSLEQIADALNRRIDKVRPPHGKDRWSAKSVRDAYVS